MVDIKTLDIGDTVKIVNEWAGCRQNKSGYMDKYLGKYMTVREVMRYSTREWKARMVEDYNDPERIGENGWDWFSEMIDFVVEDDIGELDVAELLSSAID